MEEEEEEEQTGSDGDAEDSTDSIVDTEFTVETGSSPASERGRKPLPPPPPPPSVPRPPPPPGETELKPSAWGLNVGVPNPPSDHAAPFIPTMEGKPFALYTQKAGMARRRRYQKFLKEVKRREEEAAPMQQQHQQLLLKRLEERVPPPPKQPKILASRAVNAPCGEPCMSTRGSPGQASPSRLATPLKKDRNRPGEEGDKDRKPPPKVPLGELVDRFFTQPVGNSAARREKLVRKYVTVLAPSPPPLSCGACANLLERLHYAPLRCHARRGKHQSAGGQRKQCPSLASLVKRLHSAPLEHQSALAAKLARKYLGATVRGRKLTPEEQSEAVQRLHDEAMARSKAVARERWDALKHAWDAERLQPPPLSPSRVRESAELLTKSRKTGYLRSNTEG